jgi:L-aminopeptidase/D-esterase-like protein
VERAVVREDKRTMAEARTTMDSSSRVEAMVEARMIMVVNVVRNTTDRKDSKVDMVEDRIVMAADSKVDMVVVRIIMAVDSKVAMVVVRMTMVVNVVRNITDRKDSRVDMVEDRIVMAEDSKTTALKVDAQEEETFLRAESKFFTQR